MNISEETIDSFLRGDLTGSELEEFNKALGSDPKLQQEVSFQQDIVDSIKQYRHNQLKNRLNSIEVAPLSMGAASSIYFKFAASIGIVALLIGSFVLLTKTKKVENPSVSVLDTREAKESIQLENTKAGSSTLINDQQAKALSKNKSLDSKDVRSTFPNASANKSDLKNSSVSSPSGEDETSTSELVPGNEETADEDMTFDSRSENFSSPTINNTEHSNISSSVVKVSIVKEKNLAYRYFNNELFLHGNFSNSTYELFELNNKPSKQLFLYFENNYYELIQGKTRVTDLVPITDKATLLQLAQLREH